MLAPRAMPWVLDSAGMPNHLRGRCRCSIASWSVHHIELTVRTELCFNGTFMQPWSGQTTKKVDSGHGPWSGALQAFGAMYSSAPASHTASSRIDLVLPLERTARDKRVKLVCARQWGWLFAKQHHFKQNPCVCHQPSFTVSHQYHGIDGRTTVFYQRQTAICRLSNVAIIIP